MQDKIQKFLSVLTNTSVLVAALGYFVDMFDISLYGVVRIESLNAIGITDPNEVLQSSVYLGNMGMIGMLLGGLIWGVMSDKVGRVSVLFGSILIYSMANIANAFVVSVPQYGWVRLIAGLGLAGELGAAITLVSEMLPKETRGIATTIIATLGLLGAVTASLVGQFLTWKAAYILGGTMGLALLLARIKTSESDMFAKLGHATQARKGDIRLLFSPRRFSKYTCCVLMGIPIWFITGILMTYAPELTAELNPTGPITSANALLFGSIGLTIGDLASGLLSQLMQSRKKAVGIFLFLAATCGAIYWNAKGISPELFYSLCFVLGMSAGYWAVFVTIAAEQFGTNIRGTVSSTVPNFVRGSIIAISLSFLSLKSHFSTLTSAAIVGVVCFALGSIALYLLPETYGKDLNYLEE